MKCRICHSEEADTIVNLGHHPLADAFLTKEQLDELEVLYPLVLLQCKDCSLVYISHVVPKEKLYAHDYPYETGCNSEGVAHFRQLAIDVCKRYSLGSDSLILDIGSNDGTLLSGFQDLGCKVLGVEPVQALAEKANENGVFTLNCFIGQQGNIGSLYDVITATNVFAHIDDLHSVMEFVDKHLGPEGVFVIEVPDIKSLVENIAYDTIYHEHLSYFELHPLSNLFGQHGMGIIDIDWHPIHAGTMRYHVARPTKSGLSILGDACPPEDFNGFADNVYHHRKELRDVLISLKSMGKSIVGISAPAKGNTLLNYCDIGPDLLDYVTDVSERKIGRFTPGQHLEVKTDEDMIRDGKDYGIILAWNWAEPIKKRLREKGFKGSFIVPLPEIIVE